MATATKRTVYMCSWCGKRETRIVGRPSPGKCPRKQGNKPHTWVVDRKY